MATTRTREAQDTVSWDIAQVERIVLAAIQNKGNGKVFFVHDQGVYLCVDQKGRKPVVEYAKGLNPNTDPFDIWWDEARRLVGGDDFGEELPAHIFSKALGSPLQRNKTVHIRVTEDQLEITGRG